MPGAQARSWTALSSISAQSRNPGGISPHWRDSFLLHLPAEVGRRASVLMNRHVTRLSQPVARCQPPAFPPLYRWQACQFRKDLITP